jgi:hypothetical protein
MNTDAFKRAYGESRNGTDKYHRVNPFVRRFLATDGVKECAEAGCYWLLDIFATELPPLLKVGDFGVIKVEVVGSKLRAVMETDDDKPPVWVKTVDYTDMPDGEWMFYINNDGEHVICCLPTEY